jgi:hypothetical protein
MLGVETSKISKLRSANSVKNSRKLSNSKQKPLSTTTIMTFPLVKDLRRPRLQMGHLIRLLLMV